MKTFLVVLLLCVSLPAAEIEKFEPNWIEYELSSYCVVEPNVFRPFYWYDPPYGDSVELFNEYRLGVYDMHPDCRYVHGHAVRIGKGQYKIITMWWGKIPRERPNI